jgi:hypothetical protein
MIACPVAYPIVAAVILATCVAGCSREQPPDPGQPALEVAASPTPLPSVTPLSATPQVRIATSQYGRPPARHEASWWHRPLADVHAELEALASAGDVDAAHVLGARAAQCGRTLRDDHPKELARRYEAELEILAERHPSNDAALRNAQRGLQEGVGRYEDCAAFGMAGTRAGVAWLERAGRSGNERARIAFVEHALDDYRTRGTLIANIEEASRRRQLAREWLDQGVRDGNELALEIAAESLDGRRGGLHARDEVAFQAHAYALQLVRSRRTGRFQALWRDGPDRYGEMTQAQWAEAVARGRRIFSESFEHKPVVPGP